tara:strand:- start:2331 stop:2768 length:438 start_codon:yes stop_codon:yes gene_type:complete
MNKILKKLTQEKHHSILSILLVFFIILDIKIPLQLANLIDTIVGKTIVIVTIFSLLTFNKFVGVLAIVAGYLLVMRSMDSTGRKNMRYLESENSKFSRMKKFNGRHKTSVEEEIIDNMLPRVANEDSSIGEFKPIQGNLYDAEKL